MIAKIIKINSKVRLQSIILIDHILNHRVISPEGRQFQVFNNTKSFHVSKDWQVFYIVTWVTKPHELTLIDSSREMFKGDMSCNDFGDSAVTCWKWLRNLLPEFTPFSTELKHLLSFPIGKVKYFLMDEICNIFKLMFH